MESVGLLTPARVACRSSARDKTGVLEELAGLLVQEGESGVARDAVLESLLARERLGSTGFGRGVAIPHGRVAGTYAARGACITTRCGMDFAALDDAPVDVFFALLVPAGDQSEHLTSLARIAGLLGDRDLIARVRDCESDAVLFQLLSEHLHQS